ncbi:calcium-transporting ATPase 12, plasma membrane-type-like [Macadamia integrifolia]|uniref:calcium-transporting ATPase 12, plasma membrane-type-like n=1 Tax=Macadamia integrifolia TaxID=60698 RepID=UPI001C52D0E5|nr:calcium-transporting ATPase 12, plasma membrane-type-like [Macadamia integrifolia]
MCGFKVQHCLLDLCTTLRLISIPEKRWHRAFIAICSSRILVTLAKDALDKKKDKLFASFSRSPSYTIIDIQSNIGDGTSLCFNSDHKALIEIIKEKNPDRLRQLGGVEAVVASLQTDVENGICGDAEDVASRRNYFGSNSYPKQPPKSLFHFVLEAIKDTTILILLGCAILSLGFGIRENGWKDGWYDGGSIFVAVFIVIAVSAFSNFRQSRQFEKLSRISDDIQIEVIRSGRRTQISIFDIVVGDIVCLKIGDQIPADGLFLDGHSLQVDESSMTGESDHVEVDGARNPFLISGAKVADGYGRMLVTSVGMNTAWGEMMSSINRDSNERTPLQERLDKLTLAIGKVGLVVAFLVLVVLLVRYFTGNTVDDYGNREFNGSKTKINAVLNAVVRIIADAITIVVVAIPEGLPLAVTLTLSYSMKRMMADQAMVRKLMACETMGSATTICTDKTGTLTINQMKVTEFWLGLDAIKDYASPTISSVILELLHQGAGLNSTGAIYKPHSGAVPEFSGSPTEKAILSWAALELNMEIDALNKTCTIIKVEAFNSEKKRSGLLLRKNGEKMIHIHWKGAAEMILAMCSSYYDRNGSWTFMGESERKNLEQNIQSMAANSLRCIAFAHKEITEEELEYREDGKIHQKPSEEGLTLLGLVGLKDPCIRVPVRFEGCPRTRLPHPHLRMSSSSTASDMSGGGIREGLLDSRVQENESLEAQNQVVQLTIWAEALARDLKVSEREKSALDKERTVLLEKVEHLEANLLHAQQESDRKLKELEAQMVAKLREVEVRTVESYKSSDDFREVLKLAITPGFIMGSTDVRDWILGHHPEVSFEGSGLIFEEDTDATPAATEVADGEDSGSEGEGVQVSREVPLTPGRGDSDVDTVDHTGDEAIPLADAP